MKINPKNKPLKERPIFFIVLALVALGIMGNLGEEEPEKVPTNEIAQVEQQQKEDPVVPAEKPEPVEAEPLPAPAPAPKPEPVPEPVVDPNKPTPEEAAYFAEMTTSQGPLGENLSELGQLAMDYNPFDQNWINNMALRITMVQIYCDEIKGMNSPEGRVKTMHDEFVEEGVNYLLESMDLLIYGIDNMDEASLGKASEYIDRFSAATDNYTAQLEETFDY